jgi:hypothetical protein
LNPPVPQQTPNSAVTPVPVDPSLPMNPPPKTDASKPAPLPNPFAPQVNPNQSSRKSPGQQPPVPSTQIKPANETVYVPPTQAGQRHLRVEQSDNATVYYADPRPRQLPPGAQPYGPQPFDAQPLNRMGEAPEVAPAYYQQPKQDPRIGGGQYPTRPASYPRR